MPKIKEGDIFNSAESGSFEVVKYISYTNIVVKFLATGYTCNTHGSHVRSGKIKDKLNKDLCGVGFLGVGNFKTREDNKYTKDYACWRNMIVRCYDQNNPSFGNYGGKGVKVHKSWHNFQNFAEWYTSQPNSSREGFAIDKDLFGGNEYSPDICCFIPQKLNNLIINYQSSKGTLKNGAMWIARFGGKHIGTFPTEEEAYAKYKEVKDINLIREANTALTNGFIDSEIHKKLLSMATINAPLHECSHCDGTGVVLQEKIESNRR